MNPRSLIAALWLCLALSPAAVFAQTAGKVDPTFGASLGLAGNVEALFVQPDGKVIVTGSFKRGVARLNVDGSDDTAFNASAGADDEAVTAAIQPDGKILVGGYFGTYNGVVREALVRLNPDGSVDLGFDSGTKVFGAVSAIAVQPDGKIIIGGQLTAYDGVARKGVARLNSDGSLDLTFDPGTGADGPDSFYVEALAVQPDGKILLGGNLTSFNGIARSHLVRLNKDGSVDTDFDPGTGTDDAVKTLVVQPDGKIVIGGGFTTYNGVTRVSIARINRDGSLDASFVPELFSPILCLSLALQSDGKIVAADGYFEPARNAIVRFNTDGSLDNGFDSDASADSAVYGVALQPGGKIVVGGYFGSADDMPRNSVARLNADGTLDDTFLSDVAAGPNSAVTHMLLQADGKVIVSGFFSNVGRVSRRGVARFNADGSLDLGYNPGDGGENIVFNSALQPDGKAVVGGSIDLGVNTGNLFRLNADGSLDDNFVATGLKTFAEAFAILPDGKIVVASSKYVDRAKISRLGADGTQDDSFAVAAALAKRSNIGTILAQPDGKVILCGGFDADDGKTSYRVLRLNTDGSLDPAFNPGANGNDLINSAVLQPDGKIVVVGAFTMFNGVRCRRICRLDADGNLDPSFDPAVPANGFIDTTPLNYVNLIALQPDGKMIIAGRFTTVGGTARNGFARLNADGTLDDTFDPGEGANDAVSSMQLQPDGKVIIAGDFTSVDGVVRNYLARLNADGSLDTDFVPGEGTAGIAAIVLQPDDAKVIAGGSFSDVDGTPINALARLNGSDGSLDASFAPGFGPGDTVQALALQPDDGNVLVAATESVEAASSSLSSTAALLEGGRPGKPHTQTKVQNKIHRCIKANGMFDPGFSAATDGTTLQVVALPGGQSIIAGGFAQVNGQPRADLARLNKDGSLDTGFVGAADGTIRAMFVQTTTGTVFVGGDFASVDGTARSHIARLHPDGSLDTAFAPGAGPNGTVNALKPVANGQVLIGGSFTVVDGKARGGLARLNADGTLDLSFDPGAATRKSVRHGGPRTSGVAADDADPVDTPGAVMTLDVQADGKVIVGGLFDALQNVARHNVLRLLSNGTLDTSFDPGAGTNAAVNVLQLQPDGRTLLGGNFSSVGDLERRGAARLLGDPSVVRLDAPVTHLVGQAGAKAKLTVTRTGGSQAADLTVHYTVAGDAQAGVDFKPLDGTLVIPAGQAAAVLKVKFLNAGLDAAAKRKLKINLTAGDGYTPDPAAFKVKLSLESP